MYDAHNHLQDTRLYDIREDVIKEARRLGIKRCVVNGTSADDWERVKELAIRYPDFITPSFGLHPWKSPCEGWQKKLITYLDETPNACVGECGLDRWIEGYDISLQSEIFRAQLEIAAERNLPLSVHCLRAWGPLIEILESSPLPARGFLLHSYSGSAELVARLVKLGAYFSFSGYFLHPRKGKVREAFKRMPANRIMLETDAPDMALPDGETAYPLDENINHPANLKRIYQLAAEHIDTSLVDANFERFFLSPA